MTWYSWYPHRLMLRYSWIPNSLTNQSIPGVTQFHEEMPEWSGVHIRKATKHSSYKQTPRHSHNFFPPKDVNILEHDENASVHSVHSARTRILAHFVTCESLTMGEQGKTHWSHTLGPSDGCTTLCLGPKWNIPGARGNAQIWVYNHRHMTF